MAAAHDARRSCDAMASHPRTLHAPPADQGLATAVETAERVGGVDQEVADLASLVGEELGFDTRQLRELRLVALVHDIGKQAVPPVLLAKAEPLTPVEWAVMQRHALIGQRILERVPYPARAVAAVGAIRERWDGGGYPRGLAGVEIPLSARVVAVCVAYAAIRRGGRGRLPLDHDGTLSELDRSAGSQFDPDVTRAAIVALGRADLG
jgi:HD-GYP domain-containing protein (c-di-GMP phosphodiesterase class II)